jgi:hypothetical protein
VPAIFAVVLASAILAVLDVAALWLLVPMWRKVRTNGSGDRVLAVLAPATFGGLAFIVPISAVGPLGLVVAFPAALAGVLFGVAFNVYHFWARGLWLGVTRHQAARNPAVAQGLKDNRWLGWLFRRYLP